MKFEGTIDAGDSTEKTITIQCPDGVKGAMIGARVIVEVIETNPEPKGVSTEYD